MNQRKRRVLARQGLNDYRDWLQSVGRDHSFTAGTVFYMRCSALAQDTRRADNALIWLGRHARKALGRAS